MAAAIPRQQPPVFPIPTIDDLVHPIGSTSDGSRFRLFASLHDGDAYSSWLFDVIANARERDVERTLELMAGAAEPLLSG